MQKGIEDSKHKEKLEKLLQGILVERSSSVSSYLDALESKLDNYKDDDIKTSKSKIFSLFRNWFR